MPRLTRRDHWLTLHARILRGARAITRQADYAQHNAWNIDHDVRPKRSRTSAIAQLVRVRDHANRLIGLLQEGAS